jgi:hypothetical protein
MRLTNDSADDIMPSFSPDGDRIVWIKTVPAGDYLWVMNADGSNAHQASENYRYLQHPRWSSDGNRIAFDCDSDGDNWNELAVLDLSMGFTSVVYDPNQSLVDAWLGSWSPDGAWFIFTRVVYVVKNGQYAIQNEYVERVATGGSAQRLIGTGLDGEPDLQTMDAIAPQSKVNALPQYSPASGVTVSWTGSDAGASGLANFDVQVRVGSTGTWGNWIEASTGNSGWIQGTVGTTLYFRSRARDKSGNLEAWPAASDGDTATMLYAGPIAGTVRDIRGVPMPGSPVNIQPEPFMTVTTTVNGTYVALAKTSTSHAISLIKPGYGLAAPMSITPTASAFPSHMLPPLDNYLQNGDFESGDLTDHWIVSGDPLPSLSNYGTHTGDRSVMLGSPLSFTSPAIASQGAYPAVAVDADRNVHVVGITGTIGSDQGVFTFLHATKSLTGTWLLDPSGILTTSAVPMYFSIVVDHDGGLNLVWVQQSQSYVNNVYYCYQARTASQCTAPLNISGNTISYRMLQPSDLEIDHQGGLHLIWTSVDGVKYVYRPPSGTWSAPQQVIGTGVQPSFAVDSTGTVHLVWATFPETFYSDLWYVSKPLSGNWSTPTLVTLAGSSPGPKLLAGEDNTVHMFFDGTQHMTRLSNGTWVHQTAIDNLSLPVGIVKVVMDDTGTIHGLFWSGAETFVYLTRSPLGRWTQPVPAWTIANLRDVKMAVDHAGVAHLIWQIRMNVENRPADDYSHVQTVIAAAPADFALGQAVSIPADVHRITLGLMYSSATGSNSVPALSIDDGMIVTDILPTVLPGVDWSQAWIDMSTWAGHSITVMVRLHQSAGTIPLSLQVDDVVLGSWLTPVIDDVTPNQIDAWSSTPLTVAGSNFTTTSILRINNMILGNIQWIDEQTLLATTPAALPPGIYDVWITNLAGQESVATNALRVGKQVFLPSVLK